MSNLIINNIIKDNIRIRLFYMDKDGIYIPFEDNVIGYLEHCSHNKLYLRFNKTNPVSMRLYNFEIGKIMNVKTKKFLYSNPNFKFGDFEIKESNNSYSLIHNKKCIKEFNELMDAVLYRDFLLGFRTRRK